jgi:hypothetical protein
MKTFACRSGLACVVFSLAISASAKESPPAAGAHVGTQPASATDAPSSIAKHGGMIVFQAVELQPMTSDAQPEQGDSKANRLQFVTGEQAEQHARRLQERLADPEQRSALRAEQRAWIQEYYSQAGRVLGLDAATERKLNELLTDQQMNHLEQMYQLPRTQFDSVRQAEATTRHMEALRNLLGDQGLERYQDYVATLSERRQVGLFSARLGAGNELNTDQEERLIALFQERTRRTTQAMQRSRWTMRGWQPGELPSPEQMQRESQLSTIATNEESWRRIRVMSREIEAQAATFLTSAQLAELSKYHAEEQERQRRWIESARTQAGMDPNIPEHAAAAAAPEQPRVPINGQVQVEIRLTVDRGEPTVVTRTMRNGESFTFEAADGLTAEARPTLYDDHWLDVVMTYYEDGNTGKRRLLENSTFGVQTRLPDGTPGGGGGGGSVLAGRKGYAVEVMITGTAM